MVGEQGDNARDRRRTGRRDLAGLGWMSSELPPSLLGWDEVQEPVPCGAMWVLSFPPRWLPANPHLGGGGNAGAVGIS